MSELSLRDQIAIAAMAAQVRARVSLGMMTDTIAHDAYKMADAMLAAREKKSDI